MNDPTLPPGPKGVPVFGNILQWRQDPLRFVRDLNRTYGDVATIYLYDKPFALFFRPEHIHYILVGNGRNFDRNVSKNYRHALGDGLLTSNGEFYRQQRRLIQPAFHKRRVDGYASTMVEHTHELLATWRPGTEVDMFPAMLELGLRVVAKALFNVDTREKSAELGAAFRYVVEHPLRRLSVNLPFTSYGKRMAAHRLLDGFVYDLIAQRRAEGRDVGDILSMLLRAQDEGVTMTDKQIRDQLMTIFGAGHDTTATSLTWTFYLLSEHPHVRKKLLTELHTVLAGRDPTLEDLPNLPYLEWVINESMRMYPPVWQQGRRAVDAFDLAGYHFPAGMRVMFLEWVTHYLPDVWGDPDVFRPERWDPESGQKLPPGAYFPFGGGQRMCIGMSFALLEAKLTLATILQRYTPRLAPDQRIGLMPRSTLRPKYGMRMILDPTPAPATAEAVRSAPAQA